MLESAIREGLIKGGKEALSRDFSLINQELRNRKIKRLFHFTHFSNIHSILENGISTKNHLIQNSIPFIDTDKDRLDGITESISFSVSMPNTFLLSLKNHEYQQNLVVLEIAANNLLTQPFAAFPSNAAKSWFGIGEIEKIPRYLGINGLKGLFLNPKLRKECGLSSSEPTDIQSEILFFEPISSKTIIRIHISKFFPEINREAIRNLIRRGDFPPIHADCNCGIFERWNGPIRIYNLDWESYGN